MRHRWLVTALCLGGLLMGTVHRPAASTVEPTANFDCNFCNFPRAWTLSRGEGSRIIFVADEQPDTRRVQRLAPAAEIKCLSRSEWLTAQPSSAKRAVLLLRCTLPGDDSDVVNAAVRRWVAQGVPVIVPVYLNWPETGAKRLQRRQAVSRLADAGAILCAIHGREFQVGDLSLWQGIPVDVFALDPRINGDRAFGDDFRRMADMAGPAERVAAAVALLRCRYPQLTPDRIRDRLHRFGRPTLWAEVDVQWQAGHHWQQVRPFTDTAGVERFLDKNRARQARIDQRYRGVCLDAARLLGLAPLDPGQWARQVLHVSECHSLATGRGVTVAILDHMFDPEDPALRGRMIQAGSVIEGCPVFEDDAEAGHGTWMARELVAVAPEVKVMPVRFCGPGHFGQAKDYIRGIDYAVNHGADIISISHRAIPETDQEAFDQAVKRAVARGVLVVFIHYRGNRQDVLRPFPIEFARPDNRPEPVYLVGTHFDYDDSFPYTWGVSQTAPMAAGVAALIRQVNPDLKPAEIRAILLRAGQVVKSGTRLLNARRALDLAVGGSR